jgi:cell wall-associated NlpC family hydrolase
MEEDSLVISLDSTRAKVLATARDYLGIPYRYGHVGPESFDCSGYVKYVFGNLGYELPRTSYEQYKKSQRIKAKNAQPGDLVFFTTRKRAVGHVGIYLGNNQFIHAPGKGKTVTITSLDGPYYKRRLVGFGGYL